MSSLRLPGILVDAIGAFNSALENKKLMLRVYGDMFPRPCSITRHIIDVDGLDEEAYANFDLTLTYNVPALSVHSGFLEKTRILRVLCNLGDTQWTYSMIEKLWDGDYPSTVVVDKETGEVFLLAIKLGWLEMTSFGTLTAPQFVLFNSDLSEREPFRIGVSETAMFDVLGGAEGYNHLKRNIFIEFNCGLPVRVAVVSTDVAESSEEVEV
jgi:hypothetical protein